MEEKILSIVTTIGIIVSIIEILYVAIKLKKGNMDKNKFMPYLIGGLLILISSIISKVIL